MFVREDSEVRDRLSCDTETDTGEDGDIEVNEVGEEEVVVPELDACVDPEGETVELDDTEEGAGVAASAAASNGTGVGTAVALGPGGGMPPGYEFWKMSF